MKTDQEVRAKLGELLAADARLELPGIRPGMLVFQKVAACKTLLWVLGMSDEDQWHITAAPGPAIDKRAKARN